MSHGAEHHPVRLALGRLFRPVLRALVAVLGAPRVIMDREGASAYLSRWYLLGAPVGGLGELDEQGNPKRGVRWSPGLGIYVHRFHRSDQDLALHNHPWKWAVAIVLAGGYSEERRETVALQGAMGELSRHLVRRRMVLPLSVNYITHETFHRVDLFEQDAWSVFIAGPRVSSWSFWDRDTGELTPWREYLERQRGADVLADLDKEKA